MAAYKGLVFGDQVGFSYGPLGFLGLPRLYYSSTAVLALLYVIAVHAAFCITVFYFARRLMPLVVAFIFAVAAISLSYFEAAEIVPIIMALWCLKAVADGRRQEGNLAWWPWLVAVAIAGVQLELKFNTGIFCLALLTVTAVFVFPRDWRLPVALVAELVAVLGALWVVTGAPLCDLPGFFEQSIAITNGYSAAMAYEQSGRQWEYPIALLLMASTVVAMIYSSRRWRGARYGAVLAVVAVVEYIEFRRGFVRHDVHAVPFFLVAALVPLAVRWPRAAARVGIALSVVALLLMPLVIRGPVKDLINPVQRVKALGTEARSMLTAAGRRKVQLGAKADIQQKLALGPAVLREIGDHTLHVDKYETSSVWGYGFSWRPEPVFQSYLAYSPDLDRVNADLLAGPHGPDRILRHSPPQTIDGRHPLMEAPLSELALVCNYYEGVLEGEWEVLWKGPNRCVAPRPLGTVTPKSGQPVPVPAVAGNELLVMHLRLGESLLGRLEGAVFKPPALDYVVVDGLRYRLVSANSDGPLLPCLPPVTGYSQPVSSVCPSSLEVLHDGSITVEFSAIPLVPRP